MVDFAEVTNKADGSMFVRQQAHGLDPATGKLWTLPAAGCPMTFAKSQIITAGFISQNGQLTFTMNGKPTCMITIPDGYNVPLNRPMKKSLFRGSANQTWSDEMAMSKAPFSLPTRPTITKSTMLSV